MGRNWPSDLQSSISVCQWEPERLSIGRPQEVTQQLMQWRVSLLLVRVPKNRYEVWRPAPTAPACSAIWCPTTDFVRIWQYNRNKNIADVFQTKKVSEGFARIACLEGISRKDRGNSEIWPTSIQYSNPESVHKMELILRSLIFLYLYVKISKV
jgi:hypothetical protein